MNLIILKPSDISDDQTARLKGRAFKHLKGILKVEAGQRLEVGVLDGKMGTGEVLTINKSSVELRISLKDKPPQPSPIKLVMALPRPIVLKRLLPQITAMGIKDIVLLQTNRVEKSYWASPVLTSEKLKEQMILGLEQAKDTVLPKVTLRKRFKPFVEDELVSFLKGTRGLLAHPGSKNKISRRTKEKVILVVGPEGGLVPFEVELLQAHGCTAVHMGQRILRVETAVIGLISILNNG